MSRASCDVRLVDASCARSVRMRSETPLVRALPGPHDMHSHSHSLLARLAAPLAVLLAIAASPTAGAAQGPVDHDQLWSAECALPGVGGPVHALLAFQDELIVGGEFQHVRGAIASNVARWNGAVYSRLGTGLPDVVHALAVHQGQLYAGGAFGVARWTGTAWATLPGLTLYFGPPEVFALASHGGEL